MPQLPPVSGSLRQRLGCIRQFVLLSWRSFAREPAVIFWSFGFPLLTTLVFVKAFSGSGQTTPMIVALHDSPQLETGWVEQIRAEPGLRVIDVGASEIAGESIAQALREAKAMRDLPDGLRKVFVEQKADVLVSPQGLFSVRSPEQFSAQGNALLALRERGRGAKLETTGVNIPGMRFVDWFAPGMIGLTLLTSGLFGVTFRIVSDRELGFFKRLRLGPFVKLDYIVGFSLARAAVMFVQAVILTILFHFLFDFRIQGSVLGFFAFALAGGVCTSLLGAAVGARLRKTETAGGVANVFFFPMMFLSGVYFKTENFPEGMRAAARFLPLTALNDGLRAIANEAAGFWALSVPLLTLACWCGLCLALITWFFDWGSET